MNLSPYRNEREPPMDIVMALLESAGRREKKFIFIW